MILTLTDALTILEACGSSSDPITYKLCGRSVSGSPSDLEFLYSALTSAKDIRITYYSETGKRHGTLSGMVKDRLKLVGKEDRKIRCPCCNQVMDNSLGCEDDCAYDTDYD